MATAELAEIAVPVFSGPALRAARAAAGMTRYELELATIAIDPRRRVPRETIKRWEVAKAHAANPRSEELALVALILDVPLASLFVSE